jgi:hypothetical protein
VPVEEEEVKDDEISISGPVRLGLLDGGFR